MISAVFDCVVFLQAAANPNGAAGACLDLVSDGKARLFVSQPIVDEIQSVLARTSTRKRFPQLSDESVALFLRKLIRVSVHVDDVPKQFELPRDPSDEPYLNLAISSQTQYLVSRDKDLLSLMADAQFVARVPLLAIVDPKQFLDRVRAHDSTPESGI